MFPNPAWPYLRLFDDDQRIIGMDEAIATALSGDTYADKVRAIFGSSLIDYRQLREGSGTSALDSSPKAHAAGTISGATWTANAGFDGGPALLFDGVNDYTDIYSAALNTDFNIATTQKCTAFVWYRMSASGVWSDAATRVIYQIRVDASNEFALFKNTVVNRLTARYTAGGTAKTNNYDYTPADTLWHSLALTVDKSAGGTGEAKMFHDGAQVGATLTALGTWAGSLDATLCVIASANNGGSLVHSGYIREAILANVAATPAQIAQLAVR